MSAGDPAVFGQAAVNARQAESYQRFLGAARRFWAQDLFRTLRTQVGRDIAPPAPQDADRSRFKARLEAHTTYQYFSWFERHLQRMRYSGPYGLVASAQGRRDDLVAELQGSLPEHLLSLAPDLTPPDYYTACDIHQHPGGLHGDPLAGFVYRIAVGSGVVGQPALHERFARQLVAERAPQRVVDLGCGFGRSSLAFADALPAIEVTGVDLSRSCVTLAAHSTPEPLRPRLRFVQGDAQDTGLPAGQFDLVTSTMLLHEMPEAAVRRMIAESGRLTAPGGRVAHLDFLPPDDPLLRELYAGHARRNNEPFLLEHSRVDLEAAYRAAGFDRVEVRDFQEDDTVRVDDPDRWRLPWKTIVAYKAAA